MKCECCGQVIIESKTADLDEILEYLNTKTGKKFRTVESNRKFIRARIAEGHSIEDIKAVVDRKVQEWAESPTMAQYLRPATLFNAEKFNQYVGELEAPLPEEEKPTPDWAKIPFNNESLWPWAKLHGYSGPAPSMNFNQYRSKLKGEVAARLGQ